METIDAVKGFVAVVGIPAAMAFAMLGVLYVLGKKLADSLAKNIDAQTSALPGIHISVAGVAKTVEAVAKTVETVSSNQATVVAGIEKIMQNQAHVNTLLLAKVNQDNAHRDAAK